MKNKKSKKHNANNILYVTLKILGVLLVPILLFLPLIYIFIYKICNNCFDNIYQYVSKEKFLLYYSSICSAIGTIILGGVTLYQNRKLNEERMKLDVFPYIRVEKIKKIDSYVYELIIRNVGRGIAINIKIGTNQLLDSLDINESKNIIITTNNSKKSKSKIFIRKINIENTKNMNFEIFYEDCYKNALKELCKKKGNNYITTKPMYI